MLPPRSLYVHVPFCEKKCPYCAFNSYAGSSKDLRAAYVDAALRELQSFGTLSLETVYVGGGTPTALGPRDLRRLLLGIRAQTESHPQEWTVEANPGTLDEEKVEALIAAGVNRVSMGVQSLDPDRLKRLGRDHGTEEVLESVTLLRAAGISNLNLDLIYGQPDQDETSWAGDVDSILQFETPHLSLYALQYEGETPYVRALERGQFARTPEEITLAHFELAVGRLEARGLHMYEISNFSRPGHESLHNQMYWRNDPHFSVGAGAFGFVDGVRYQNETDPRRYIERIDSSADARIEAETLDEQDLYVETLASGLRTQRGVDLGLLLERTGRDPRVENPAWMAVLLREGLGEVSHETLRLTRKGLWVLDAIVLGLMEGPAELMKGSRR